MKSASVADSVHADVDPPAAELRIGTFVTDAITFLERLGRLAAFAPRAVLASFTAFFRPELWLRPLYSVTIGGLPLALVTGLALGVVIWMHTRDVLARTGTGAVEYLPTFLAAAVLLELAPVGAGLIVAARTGASLGAELASMRVSEQIDAMELLGVSTIRALVGPRIVACVFAAPLLHIFIAATALGSGFIAELSTGSTTYLKYDTAAVRELLLRDVVPAGLKTLAFGLVVGVTGCFAGLNAREGSEGVGRAATASVVACVLLVLAVDVLLVGLIKMMHQFL
ncbi:ABC transporter permease [Gemmata sp. JC673]|uniref:ABC transporter permease n=1 Tax=Gemmata algarum TaxID=2975278 RepID=A0ABU5EQ55_9BACT|nr:ABC transporter permease [Gemmata algarum]MDY3557496.1 ABC transporter permease [Gemmata algarum]